MPLLCQKLNNMPRNKITNQFEAGMLPIVTVGKKKYYVDGRLQELRNVNDFSDTLTDFNSLSEESIRVVAFEFYGNQHYNI